MSSARLVLSFAVLLGLLYLVYIGVSFLVLQLTQIDPVVIGALLAALAGVFGYWYTQRQTTSRQIQETHRAKKIELYEEFMGLLEYNMDASRKNKKVDPEKPTDKETKMYQSITRGLLIWGSPKLIKKWLDFRRTSSQTNNSKAGVLAMDEVFRAFRDELNITNAGLKRGELVSLFLKDPDELNRLH